MDKHHVAGRANSPVTIPIYVNDHRAVLSVAQKDWPKITQENPHGCPLIAAAGCIRGFIDMARYLIETLLYWVADMLERLAVYLSGRLGPNWWIGTEFEQFAAKGKCDVR